MVSKKDFTPNRWEKTLASIAPDYARKCYQTRCAMAMAESYVGASRKRRSMSDWFVSDGDADSDILPDLSELRQRSRDLNRNNAIAGAVINTKTTNIVGSGLRLQARINADVLGLSPEVAAAWENNTEQEFRIFCKTCDYERTLNFMGLEELALRSTLENGDTLCLTPYRKNQGDIYGLKIQLVEADRICNEDNISDSANLAGGVERVSDGVTRYHVLNSHPGSQHREDATWTKYDAFSKSGRRNAWLLYHKIRIGQSRGVPDLAPVVEELKQLGRYKEAELMATVVSSLFTVFIKSEQGDGLGTPGQGKDEDYKLQPGAILDLAQDEDALFANPGRPNPAFEAFISAATREIGARLELPYEILMKSFTASYSASRAALLEAWRFFRARRVWLADNFCRPIYELFLTEAVSIGRIAAPGFLTGDPRVREAWLGSDWVGDNMGHIDEGKAVGAAKARIDAGLSNESIETVELTGRDRDQVYRQRKKEIEQRRNDKMMDEDIQVTKRISETKSEEKNEKDPS